MEGAAANVEVYERSGDRRTYEKPRIEAEAVQSASDVPAFLQGDTDSYGIGPTSL